MNTEKNVTINEENFATEPTNNEVGSTNHTSGMPEVRHDFWNSPHFCDMKLY